MLKKDNGDASVDAQRANGLDVPTSRFYCRRPGDQKLVLTSKARGLLKAKWPIGNAVSAAMMLFTRKYRLK